jgi:hypothetical protein
LSPNPERGFGVERMRMAGGRKMGWLESPLESEKLHLPASTWWIPAVTFVAVGLAFAVALI